MDVCHQKQMAGEFGDPSVTGIDGLQPKQPLVISDKNQFFTKLFHYHFCCTFRLVCVSLAQSRRTTFDSSKKMMEPRAVCFRLENSLEELAGQHEWIIQHAALWSLCTAQCTSVNANHGLLWNTVVMWNNNEYLWRERFNANATSMFFSSGRNGAK